MRALTFIILCCILSNSCYAPRKYNKWEQVGSTMVVETNPIERGQWEIIWEDNRGGEHRTVAKDTVIFHKGYSMKTLLKL